MQYKSSQLQSQTRTKMKPRIIIHGGAGNIRHDTVTPEKYAVYRGALLTIITQTNTYMQIPTKSSQARTALEIATHAVTLLENNPLFNAGHGAVFTRDGINELEASVMVSRGFAKRGVGVTGVRHVKNPILLAKAMLEHGESDLLGKKMEGGPSVTRTEETDDLDVPSAQGHTLLHGPTAEVLARKYGLEMVEPEYYFTQTRWDEHMRALQREKQGVASATWSAEEYLPQGTVGAVALDSDGLICVATSTGGLTNKLTGRIGDTPSLGAGFWAEEWEDTVPGSTTVGPGRDPWARWTGYLSLPGPVVELSAGLKGFLADCLPSPFVYTPVTQPTSRKLITTRSMGTSGTGNGDSFLRVAACRTVGAIARFAGASTTEALRRVAGRGGELEKSAGWRWGKNGEGEGGMIAIECVIVRDAVSGEVVEARGEVLADMNCGGMWRAWIDDDGAAQMRVWNRGTGLDSIDFPTAEEMY